MKLNLLDVKDLRKIDADEEWTKEELVAIDKALDKWFNDMWEPARKKIVKEMIEAMDPDSETVFPSYEKCYAALGKFLDVFVKETLDGKYSEIIDKTVEKVRSIKL